MCFGNKAYRNVEKVLTPNRGPGPPPRGSRRSDWVTPFDMRGETSTFCCSKMGNGDPALKSHSIGQRSAGDWCRSLDPPG